ncbi:MAG TPA: AI-2E family transporter [Devosia sp.]|nr:AI-2E family transporter [Devosia sp.]
MPEIIPTVRTRRRHSTFETVAVFAILAAVLYLGAGIIVPVVLATLLAFALTPLVTWFNRRLHLPDPIAVLLAVLIAAATLGGFVFLAGVQVARLAQELPAYQQTISGKIEGLQDQFGGGVFFDRINDTIGDLNEQLSEPERLEPSGRSSEPVPVTISNEIGPMGILSSVLGSIIGPVATAAIVTVFLIFLLMGRADLQDRFIRLVGAGGYSKTNMAVADASRRVGRYLLIQLSVNVTYGFIFGVGLWLIGVPSAVLWGLLIILFRYIPFVGALIIAVVPFLLAFAVDPGWDMLLKSVALFLVLDLTTANAVEPRLYGSSTGVSAIAILLSAMFWATLWGPIGLILATPMTVCLVVIGRHLPQLQFLETLLGSEPVLSPPERLYQRMHKGDAEDAIDMTDEYVDQHGSQRYLREVMLPALHLATRDLSDRPEALHQRRQLVQSFEAIVEEISDVDHTGHSDVLLVGGRSEIDECAARLLAISLDDGNIGSTVLPPVAVRQEAIGRLDLQGVGLVALVFLGPVNKAQARYVSRRVRRMAPGVKVLVCAFGDEQRGETVESLHVDAIYRSMDSAMAGIAEILAQIGKPVLRSGKASAFAGAGRGDDALGHAIQEIADGFDVPVAAINLLDDERHAEDEGAFRLTRLVAESGKPLVVHSHTPHPLVKENAYLQTNGIDLYVGAPLTLEDGRCVGALVLLDYEPRDFSDDDIARLQVAANDLVERFA